MKPTFFALLASALLLPASLSAAVVGKVIEYPVGEVLCEGWHAYDDAVEGKRPSVLVVHQWTGPSDYEKMRAEQLVALGYNVFVLDIYGKGVRPQPPESGQEAGKYKGNRALFRKRLEAGLQVLRGLPQTDSEKIAAIGYCFGGTGVLELARAGADIEGVVSFHGGLGSPTPEDAKNIDCDVLVLHGADDPHVPPAEVEAFHREMKAADVDYEFVAYPGAVHSFTQKKAGDDPSKGSAYHSEADAKSWEAMKAFFVKIFAD